MQNKLITNNILSILETNKEQQKEFAANVLDRMQNEEIDPLKVHCQIKSLQSIVDCFLDKKTNANTAENYSKIVLNAAEKHGKKFGLHNAEFQIKEAGTKYDWSVCEDAYLNELLAELENLNEKIKERQTFLKTITTKGLITTDENTGETYTIYPPAKSSTTIVSVSIK